MRNEETLYTLGKWHQLKRRIDFGGGQPDLSRIVLQLAEGDATEHMTCYDIGETGKYVDRVVLSRYVDQWSGDPCQVSNE